MKRLSYNPWPVRLVTLALWVLAGASVVFWGMRLATPASRSTAASAPAPLAAPDAQAIARLLGAQAPAAATAAAPPPLASRYSLVGVLAGEDGTTGAALIAVGGEHPKPFRVGSTVDGTMILQSLDQNGAKLGPKGGAAMVSLELPLPKPPARAAQ